MIGKAVKYFKGYVDFYAEGADIEGFLTDCVKDGIYITSIKKQEYKFWGTIDSKDYKRIRKKVRKHSLKAVIIKKHGIKLFYRKHKNKIGFLIGTIFIYLSILFMNLFIWEINVIGNDKIDINTIIKSAEKTGLVTGTLSKKHFTPDMEWFVMNENEGIANVEINIQGSVANIIISESLEKPEMKYDDDVPTNIVASRYGVIRSLDVFDGWEKVNVGDAVMKGDLLVSAVFEDRHNKLTLKHARAKILAETDYKLNVEFPFKEIIKTKGKKEKVVYDIDFLGKNLKFGKHNNSSDFLSSKESKQIYFLCIKLPIKVDITTYYSVKQNTITHSMGDAKNKALELLEEKERKEMAEMKIISKKLSEKIKNEKYIINAEYIVLMDICEEQPLESDIPWENTDDMS